MRYEIVNDNDAANPRTEWDNLGTIAYKHRRYVLGDEEIGDVEEWLKEKEANNAILLPVYAYEHGNICLKTSPFSCSWDSGQVGFIYCDLDKVRKEFGVKRVTAKMRERVEAWLRGEIETFSAYLSGEVYGIRIFDANGEEIDSCYGFYGYQYAKEEARRMLEEAKNRVLETQS